jgi:hypothetical protein
MKTIHAVLLFLLASLVISIASGCAGFRDAPVQDQLSLVVDVITLRVDRTTNLVTRGLLTPEEAQKRLARATTASVALHKAEAVIISCEGAAGKCDLSKLTQDLGGEALTALADHLYSTGDPDDMKKAEAIDAVRIVHTLMRGSATPGAGTAFSPKLTPLIARFDAAIARLQVALKAKA